MVEWVTAALTALMRLNLSLCRAVAADGVARLAACTALVELDLQGCMEVSSAVEAELRAALPHVSYVDPEDFLWN